jgi:hypothetical protein
MAGTILTLRLHRGSFEAATDVHLGHFGPGKAGTVRICKTRTSARMLMGSIRDLFGKLLVLVHRVSFPNDLGVSCLSHRWPLLPRPKTCQIYPNDIMQVNYLE